uniref:Protein DETOXIFICATION n=1 Tax=Leersia perrieri TaxID=77586 RepID=A0A0D9VF17_9ORYZ
MAAGGVPTTTPLLESGAGNADAAAVTTAGEAARMVWEETQRLWRVGLPIVVSSVSLFAICSTTNMFVGHLGNLPLAAASIAFSVFCTFSFGFLLGMGSALETLSGQAFGAGQVAMLGVYLQRSWIVLLAAGLLMVPIYLLAEPILLLAGQDADVAREAGKFTACTIPTIFAFAINFPSSKFLQAQSKVAALAWIGLAGLAVHVAAAYALVYAAGWGMYGAAAALDASLWGITLAQVAYIVGWCGGEEGGWRGWSAAAFCDMWPFVKLSLESALMLCLEMWYLSILTVLAGNLADAQIAVDSLGICTSIDGWEATVFFGINAAISIRVSNELGSGRPRAAMFAVIVAVVESLMIGLLCMVFVLVFRDHFSIIFTSDVKLRQAVAKIAGLLGLTMVLNSVQPVISGVAVGGGWQGLVAYINVGCYYAFGLPLGYILGYKLDYGVGSAEQIGKLRPHKPQLACRSGEAQMK